MVVGRPNTRTTRRKDPRRAVAGAVLLIVIAGAFTAWKMVQAAEAGQAGKRSLLAAEAAIARRDVAGARAQAQHARGAFARMQDHIAGIGPLRVPIRVFPFVRVQYRGAVAYADAGQSLAASATELVEAAAGVLQPPSSDIALSDGLESLRRISSALARGRRALEASFARVASLDGYRLIGPLATAQEDLRHQLARARERVRSADQGLAALLDFLGDAGPRRYLVVSQNPDEVRPTGGFIGTYGLLQASEGDLTLERFASIESWYAPRPQAAIPPEAAPNAFKIPDPPARQTIANANATADWPRSARLMAELWQRGGEQPVDGVVSLTPEAMARILAVLGPVAVPSYGETLTAANLIERLDFHTHLAPPRADQPDRKQFVADMARAVMEALLRSPARLWSPLASTVADSFDARETMVWVAAPEVGRALAERRWDGSLPADQGDFFYQGEFAYAAKNGRGIRRNFDHDVTLRKDGSAKVVTRITIHNTLPFNETGLVNIDTLSYITVYGPVGATLDEASDTPYSDEDPVDGHPAAGWDRAAAPGETATLTVAWEAPDVALRQRDGSLEYRLQWMRVTAHDGDTLNLKVNLPAGWAWAGPPPPDRVVLDEDFSGSWKIGR